MSDAGDGLHQDAEANRDLWSVINAEYTDDHARACLPTRSPGALQHPRAEDLGVTVLHHAVGGDLGAGADQHQVTGRHLRAARLETPSLA